MNLIRSVAEAAAHAAQADLLRLNPTRRVDLGPCVCSVAVTGEVWTVSVVIAPTNSRQSLGPAERDILATLAAAGIPLSTSRVLSELARRGIDHSETTVKRRLAALVKVGALQSRTQPPRGYCLPGQYPDSPATCNTEA